MSCSSCRLRCCMIPVYLPTVLDVSAHAQGNPRRKAVTPYDEQGAVGNTVLTSYLFRGSPKDEAAPSCRKVVQEHLRDGRSDHLLSPSHHRGIPLLPRDGG
jgi:hypothetical protein